MSSMPTPLRNLSLHLAVVVAGSCVCALTACVPSDLSVAEMRAAVQETVLQGEGLVLENEIMEITTSFTVGDAVSEIITEVQAFTESQIPCSTVEKVDARTLAIDFGTLDDQCTYEGRTYAGRVQVGFKLNSGSIDIAHTYEGLTNGDITLDGTAEVTWTADVRTVVTDLTFVGERGTVEVSSDRTQTLLDPEAGASAGVAVEGQRRWGGSAGDWLLDIEGVEWRGMDPLPQAGSYSLLNPDGKEITMSFSRVDEDTIAVTIESLRGDRMFHVSSTGRVTDEGDA